MDDTMFSEDELFVPTCNFGPKVGSFNKVIITTKETNLNVLLELNGDGPRKDTLGVDIVTVIDVSKNMSNYRRLEEVKIAMKHLIEKLSPIHRLSVVTFSASSNWLCSLRQMTEIAQADIKALVDELVADGTTNIAAGLETALKVLDGRRFSHGRVAAILLMSYGDEMHGNAAHVLVGDVPVYTFNVGGFCESDVLNTITNNSKGGTYSIVNDENLARDKLSAAISQCLAGLLTVVVQDLKLTIIPVKSNIDDQEIQPQIEEVLGGNYQQSTFDVDGSITISFGNLYKDEKRNVFLDLLLPAVKKPFNQKLLQITHSYSVGMETYQGPPLVVDISRSDSWICRDYNEVIIEQARLEIIEMMGMAIQMCDNDKFDDANDNLQEAIDFIAGFEEDEPDKDEFLELEAINMMNVVDDKDQKPNLDKLLEDLSIKRDKNHPFPLLNLMKKELKKLLELMDSADNYKSKGRQFALATLTSHARQRFAARDDVESPYSTPAMKMAIAPIPITPKFNKYRLQAVGSAGPSILAFKARKGVKGKEKSTRGKENKENTISGEGRDSLPKPQTTQQRGPINR